MSKLQTSSTSSSSPPQTKTPQVAQSNPSLESDEPIEKVSGNEEKEFLKPNENNETPSVKYVDSLDAKIIQYLYSIIKLQSLLVKLKSLILYTNSTKVDLPLVQYIVLLIGNLFAINESAFAPRINMILSFKLFKMNPVTINIVLSHIPYDNQDSPVTPLETLPSVAIASKCLRLIDFLCNTCLNGYQKRLQAAKEQKNNDELVGDFERILRDQVFHVASDIDLTLGITDVPEKCPFIFPLPPPDGDKESALLSDTNFIEASLIDMDIKTIFSITNNLEICINKLTPQIIKFKYLKHLPKTQQSQYIKSLPDSQFALHKILMFTFRLNDLYSILRMFGRKIYLSNYQHLYDQKFSFNSKASFYFKNQLLKEIDELFNSTKKNGVLIANLTRFIRANSIHENNSKNILEFVNFINQAFSMIDNQVKKFHEFGNNWIQAELLFRKNHNLPINNLIKINENKSSQKKVQAESNSEHSSNKSSPLPDTNTGLNTQNKNLKSVSQRDKSTINKLAKPENDSSSTPSRTSSISSNNSTTLQPPLLSVGNNKKSTVVRRRSISTSTPIRSPNALVQNTKPIVAAESLKNSSIASGRPNSMMFFNSDDSLNTFHDAKSSSPSAPQVARPAPVGRRRSNSQPLPGSAAATGLNSFGTGAAAAALKSSNSPNGSLKSPSGSIRSPTGSIKSPTGSVKRASSLSRINGSSDHLTNNKTNNSNDNTVTISKNLNSVEESEEEITSTSVKLTANQRLQQHIRQATKSGSMMTQQKEVFTQVVFDPNSPSSVNFKKSIESSPTVEKFTITIPNPPVPSKPVPPKGKTRDQVTKMNTKKNSLTAKIDEGSENSSINVEGGSTTTDSKSSEKSSLSGSSSIEDKQNSTVTDETITDGAVIDDSTIKKVRFIGVPEYTAAEDAPTKYSNRILKNFAVFKTPLIINKPALKKKDQLLKKEESYSFKHNLEPQADPNSDSKSPASPNGNASNTNQAISAAAAMSELTSINSQSPLSRPLGNGNNRLSKLRSKFL